MVARGIGAGGDHIVLFGSQGLSRFRVSPRRLLPRLVVGVSPRSLRGTVRSISAPDGEERAFAVELEIDSLEGEPVILLMLQRHLILHTELSVDHVEVFVDLIHTFLVIGSVESDRHVAFEGIPLLRELALRGTQLET
jgi:hypothetical protein